MATELATGKRQQNRIEQRERILQAARVLFGERGFSDVTVSEIARAAGVARATVFNYFPTKHALIDGITADVYEVYLGFLGSALALEGVPTPTLVRALFEHMSRIENLHRFYKEVFREVAQLQVGLAEGGEAAIVRDRAVERVVELLERGQARGEIRTDHAAPDLAWAFESLALGTITRWLYDDPSKSLRDRMARAAEIFLGPVATAARPDEQEALPEFSAEF